jgi:hypothetical protein
MRVITAVTPNSATLVDSPLVVWLVPDSKRKKTVEQQNVRQSVRLGDFASAGVLVFSLAP